MSRRASNAERSRARRLRSRADLSPADRAWLEAYDAERAAARSSTNAAPKVGPPPPPKAAAPPPAPPSSSPAFVVEPDEHERTEDEEEVEIPERLFFAAGEDDREDDREDEDDTHEPDAVHCPLGPDCPACSAASRRGAQRCTVTGRLVWPPMTEKQARSQATAVLGGMGWAISRYRSWRLQQRVPFVLPTEDERAELAEALDEIQRRHASWLAFGAEFTALLSALGRYGVRAATAPADPPPAPDTRQEAGDTRQEAGDT